MLNILESLIFSDSPPPPPTLGTMMGITNTVATIPGIVGPELVGYLTANNVCIRRLPISNELKNITADT